MRIRRVVRFETGVPPTVLHAGSGMSLKCTSVLPK